MSWHRVAPLWILSALPLGCVDGTTAPGDAAPRNDLVAAFDAADVAVEDPVGGPPTPRSTAHCDYAPLPAPTGVAGTVREGDLRAGVAETLLELPVGSTLGAYTGRARSMGQRFAADDREIPYAGSFLPSVGVEHAPRVRALALDNGDDRVVILKADIGVADDTVLAAVEAELGAAWAGRVIFATSHTHSGPGHYVANEVLSVGFGVFRRESHAHLIARLVRAAREAIASLSPARLGVHHEPNFDPRDEVSRDRRAQNDALAGGRRKDNDLYVLRVDREDGVPLAVVPVVGVHPTVLDADNPFASADAAGAIEAAVEETFDRPVLVMHLQGSAGDVSPAGRGGINCDGADLCLDFARAESVGRAAAPWIRAGWTRAGESLRGRVALEVLTRAVNLGPDWRNFEVRDGGLRYLDFDLRREADRAIFGPDGGLLSPLDEFNAPFGAALCGGTGSAITPRAQMPGTLGLPAYQSCNRVEGIGPVLGPGLGLSFPRDQVLCGTTRTTVTALRLGGWYLATLPGEPLTLLGDRLRRLGPDPAHTIVVGYAQGHIGYVLTAEDWLSAGYEPSINVWGPLEGEAVMEQSATLLRLAATPAREDPRAGATRWVPPLPAAFAAPDAAPQAGEVPTTLPATLYVPALSRRGARPVRAQPADRVLRGALAHFVWIGEDPRAGTPRVTLEHSDGDGAFVPVRRRSGRIVQDRDLLLTVTPDPIASPGVARRWVWAVEWQALRPGGTGGDDLAARADLPLGRYRFRVEGTGYAVRSEPFEVVAGALDLELRREDASLSLRATRRLPLGYRLLDLQVPSNGPVPLRDARVTLTLSLDDGGTRTLERDLDNEGRVRLMGTEVPLAQVRRVLVQNAAGDRGSAALP
ncbi:MAG: neutral/alkaline non-lysosomal ceramidase N-terminal domain-containing protein [Polyangiales bacterium]